MGTTDSKHATYTEASGNIPFPQAFEARYDKSWKNLSLILGEDKEHPRYLADLPSGWHGGMVLYDGPTKGGPRLATAKNVSLMKSGSIVTLANGQQVEIKPAKGLLSETREFVLQVGGEGSLPEKFTWLRAKRDEARDLGESSLLGWKLVRTSGRQPDEVVAMWVQPKISSSWMKAAHFEFQGSGATGELGPLWTVVTVVSFLRMWQEASANAVVVAVS